MERKEIMFSAKRQAPDRIVGDPPSLGRVERVARKVHGDSRKKSRSGRNGSKRRRNRNGGGKAARRLSVLVFLLTILTIVVTFILWSDKRLKQSTVSKFEKFSKMRPVERVGSKFKSPSEEQTRAIVTAALEAKSEADVVTNFRLNGVAPAEVLAYLRHEEEVKGMPRLDQWVGSVDFNNTLMDSILVAYEGSEKKEMRVAMLTPDEQGVWRLDYESFARKCEPAWDQFISGEASEGIVRIWFTKDNYFNAPYADDSKWLSFSMGRVDSEDIIYGYCPIDSPQAEAMAKVMKRLQMNEKIKASLSRATLLISRAEGAGQRQFEIKRVLAEDWLLTETAFDGLPMPSSK
jgi:hypothetical protein